MVVLLGKMRGYPEEKDCGSGQDFGESWVFSSENNRVKQLPESLQLESMDVLTKHNNLEDQVWPHRTFPKGLLWKPNANAAPFMMEDSTFLLVVQENLKVVIYSTMTFKLSFRST